MIYNLVPSLDCNLYSHLFTPLHDNFNSIPFYTFKRIFGTGNSLGDCILTNEYPPPYFKNLRRACLKVSSLDWLNETFTASPGQQLMSMTLPNTWSYLVMTLHHVSTGPTHEYLRFLLRVSASKQFQSCLL